MRLYELKESYRKVADMIEQLDDEAVKADGAALLDEISDSIEEKCLNIARLVKNMSAESEAIKAEEKRLAARRNAIDNRVQSLKEYAQGALELAGIEKCKDDLFAVALQNSPPSLRVIDPKKIPEMYWNTPEPELDKKGLLSDIKAGAVVDGAELQQGKHLRIR